MAIGLQITTDEGSFDLYEREDKNFFITRQIFDINELQSRKGDFTRNIRIPGTARNNFLLGDVINLQNIGKKEQTIDCRILLDGVTVAPVAKLLHVSSQVEVGIPSFNIVIFYGNFNLFDNILGGGINEMNWADIAIDWTTTNLAALSNDTSSHGWFLADWFVRGQGNIIANNIWDIKQSGFFIYSKEIIDRIVLEAGFTTKYTNVPVEFFNHALAIPVTQFIIEEETKSALQLGEVSKTDADQVVTGATEKATFNNIIDNADGLWSALNNEFTVAISEDYTIVIQGTVDFEEANPATPACEVRIVNNGGTVATESFAGDGTDVSFFLSVTLPLLVDDVIHIDLFAPVNGPLDSVLTLKSVSLFNLTESGGAPSNTVQPENYIPNIERKDYLVGVLAHYGLMIRTNGVDNEVEIKPLEEVSGDTEQDWSDNLDIGGDKSIFEAFALTGYARNNKVEYLEDSTVQRTDFNHIFTSENQILNLNKTIISFPYSASDNSQLFPGRLPMINVPMAGAESRGFVGQAVTISGNNFTLSSTDTLDFHVGNYLVVQSGFDFEQYYIDSKSSATSGTFLGTGLTTKSSYGIDGKSSNNTQPRAAVIRTSEERNNSLVDFDKYLTDGNNVNETTLLPIDRRTAHFLDSMRAVNILDKYYATLIATVQNPQFIQAWFSFASSEFVDIDLFRSTYLKQFNARYFINKINQFKSGESVRVDLIRIDETAEEESFSVVTVDPNTITNPVHTVTVDGGGFFPYGVSQPFDAGSEIEHSATLVGAAFTYTLTLRNDLSGTVISSLLLPEDSSVSHTIIPKDEVNWEGGNIYALLEEN